MKSRNVSTFDFLDALQEEYMCAVVRQKIYPRISDKNHYKKVAEGKAKKIKDIATKNGLTTIFDDQKIHTEYWKRIIRDFGFPSFIYNQEYNTSKAHFPYKGTILEILDEDSEFQYAVSHNVDFDNREVEVVEKEGDTVVHRFHYTDVRRLSLEETDKMFYYYSGNEFKVRKTENDTDVQIGILTSFDFEQNLAWIRLKGEGSFSLPYQTHNVARIL